MVIKTTFIFTLENYNNLLEAIKIKSRIYDKWFVLQIEKFRMPCGILNTLKKKVSKLCVWVLGECLEYSLYSVHKHR